jgi:NADPH-dependent 2,4-dienoyl-CoA reductase/sulfur reductase-like enzyme
MLQMRDFERIAVVGASLAGLRGAEELRRAGFGGELTLVGAESHFPPIDRPPLSKEVLASQWRLEDARLRLFEELNATTILDDPAAELDLARRTLILTSGRSVRFDGVMIATGAAVRHLRCPGADLSGVMYFRGPEDCLALVARLAEGPRIVIVGAGFIGSEIAAVCRGRGVAVTMIDAASLPLEPQLGSDIASYVMQQHRRHGVELRTGVGVQAIEGDTRVRQVRLTDGETVPADVVIVGIGVTPATGWLKGSGVALDDGVSCDQHCRALGVDDVVAAGDVASWLNPAYGRTMRVEHWTNAVEQAEYAARSLLGDPGPGYSSVPFFWSDQYDMHLQSAGIRGEVDEIADGSFDTGKVVVESRIGDEVVGVLAINWRGRFQRLRRALTSAVMASPRP